MSLIAVTGGIGVGKTTVLQFFQKFGARTLDADDVAHKIYLPGSSVYLAIVSRWGSEVLLDDGHLNRQIIAKKAFYSTKELCWLNSVTHPAIRRDILAEVEKSAVDLYCAIPLLYETEWQKDAKKVISLWCDKNAQRERLLQRGWSEKEIGARIDSQISMEEKLLRADFGIISICSCRILELQCKKVYEQISR
ncbi:MAG: dephospho-CoA kinase [Lentisphaeria bacterium]